MHENIKNYIKNSIAVREKLLQNKKILENIEQAANMIIDAYKNGGKVMLAGNGGSASDAQHIACELVVKFQKERKGLPAIALNTDPSITTAIGNDFGYENLFSKQICAYANKNDIFIGISTSGKSPNIIQALKTAQQIGIKTISLLGEQSSEADKYSNIKINAPSSQTPVIQEMHIMIGHLICDLVEKELF